MYMVVARNDETCQLLFEQLKLMKVPSLFTGNFEAVPKEFQ